MRHFLLFWFVFLHVRTFYLYRSNFEKDPTTTCIIWHRKQIYLLYDCLFNRNKNDGIAVIFFAKWIRPLLFCKGLCFAWFPVHFRVSWWTGSDGLRNVSIKRSVMLKSSRLCPLVWSWLAARLPASGGTDSGKAPLCFPWVVRPRCILFLNPIWLSRVVCGEIMQQSAVGPWMNSSSRKDNMSLSIRHNTTQRLIIPLLPAFFLFFFFSFVFLLHSSSPFISSPACQRNRWLQRFWVQGGSSPTDPRLHNRLLHDTRWDVCSTTGLKRKQKCTRCIGRLFLLYHY